MWKISFFLLIPLTPLVALFALLVFNQSASALLLIFVLAPILIITIVRRRNFRPDISTVINQSLALWVGFVLLAYISMMSFFDFSNRAKYLTTITIETPEGTKQASGVREARWYGKGYANFDGEAIVVDLGQRGVLFALPDTNSGYGISYHDIVTFPLRDKPPIGVKYTLEPERYPSLVKFKNLNDPASSVTANGHMEELFGTGVRLKEITLETTTEPVTRILEKWLPWAPCLAHTETKPELSKKRQEHLNGLSLYGLITWREYKKKKIDCSSFWNEQYANEQSAFDEVIESANVSSSATEQYAIGEKYFYGDGRAINYNEALNWYKKAADQGYPEAMKRLGAIYQKGKGTARDPVEAIKWYRKAAESGDVSAQKELAHIYEVGAGVPWDFKEAYFWKLITSKNPEAHVESDWADKTTGMQLTVEEREAVKKKALEWKPQYFYVAPQEISSPSVETQESR
jgi:hypothetical protein